MLRPRIIPCLLVRNGGLVKTVAVRATPKYVGDPINAVKIFNEKEVDELIVLDIDATRQRREPDFKLIAQLAVECRMPLCYGGGVKTVEQAKTIIGLGVEKVAISSAAVENPALMPAIADEVGSQSVVVVLDVRKAARRGRLRGLDAQRPRQHAASRSPTVAQRGRVARAPARSWSTPSTTTADEGLRPRRWRERCATPRAADDGARRRGLARGHRRV